MPAAGASPRERLKLMEEMTGASAETLTLQDKAVALKKVSNVLWRSSHLAARCGEGTLMIPYRTLQAAYEAAYPDSTAEEYVLGLLALSEIQQISISEGGTVSFDLSSLGG